MIQKRNVGISILLSLVTCGIYSIYWFIKLTDEANYLSGEMSTSGGLAFLFSLVTCGIYSIFWAYNIGKKMMEAQRKAGMIPNDNSILYIILSVLGLQIVVFAIVQSDINNLSGNINALI